MRIPLGLALAILLLAAGGWLYTLWQTAVIERRFPPRGLFVAVGRGARLHYTEREPAGPVRATVVLLHGLLPHRSSPNTSPRSRAAYSLHVVEAGAHYPADNWLQRPAGLPARGF